MAVKLMEHARRRYIQRCPAAVGQWDRINHEGPNGKRDLNFERASGLVVCWCGHQLYDHPDHPYEPTLTITCDGDVVKL